MTQSVVIEALGVPIRLDLQGLPDAETSAVRAAWRDAVPATPEPASAPTPEPASAPTPEPEGTEEPQHVLRVREHGDGSDLATLLERLSQRVTLEAITARRSELWMLHAAGLALPDGRVIVLIGPSGRGKTTASRALGAVLGYVSDETVAIDRDGRVWPYRKPLSIIEGGALPKVQRAPSDIGLGALPDAPLRLAAIVLLDRAVDAADQPIVEPVDLGDALEELVLQSSYLPSLELPLRVMAELVGSVGGVQRVVYREASSLPQAVPALLAGAVTGGVAGTAAQAFAGDPRPVPHAAANVGTPALAAPQVPAWFRGAVLDELELTDPDRVAVLQPEADGGGTLRVLAGIAPTLRRAARGASRDELVGAALAEHGAPEEQDAGSLVDVAIADLAEAGLLEWRAGLWTVRDDVAWTGELPRFVVLPLGADSAGGGSPSVLAGSASAVWQAVVDGPGSTAEIVDRVADLVDTQPEAVRTDVEVFLRDLAERGLLTLG